MELRVLDSEPCFNKRPQESLKQKSLLLIGFEGSTWHALRGHIGPLKWKRSKFLSDIFFKPEFQVYYLWIMSGFVYLNIFLFCLQFQSIFFFWIQNSRLMIFSFQCFKDIMSLLSDLHGLWWEMSSYFLFTYMCYVFFSLDPFLRFSLTIWFSGIWLWCV